MRQWVEARRGESSASGRQRRHFSHTIRRDGGRDASGISGCQQKKRGHDRPRAWIPPKPCWSTRMHNIPPDTKRPDVGMISASPAVSSPVIASLCGPLVITNVESREPFTVCVPGCPGARTASGFTSRQCLLRLALKGYGRIWSRPTILSPVISKRCDSPALFSTNNWMEWSPIGRAAIAVGPEATTAPSTAQSGLLSFGFCQPSASCKARSIPALQNREAHARRDARGGRRSRRVVHRDLQPASGLVDPEGEPRVFGRSIIRPGASYDVSPGKMSIRTKIQIEIEVFTCVCWFGRAGHTRGS